MISLRVGDEQRGLIDEADLRRIAESIVVIQRAASDTTVWTAQPLG